MTAKPDTVNNARLQSDKQSVAGMCVDYLAIFRNYLDDMSIHINYTFVSATRYLSSKKPL